VSKKKKESTYWNMEKRHKGHVLPKEGGTVTFEKFFEEAFPRNQRKEKRKDQAADIGPVDIRERGGSTRTSRRGMVESKKIRGME